MGSVHPKPAVIDADERTRSPALRRLAEDIRSLRLARGLSQPQLGHIIGFTKQYISLAEQGATVPSEDLVQAIDNALGAEGELVDARTRAVAERKSLRFHMATSLWPHEQVVVGDDLSELDAAAHEASEMLEWADSHSVGDMTLADMREDLRRIS